MKKVLRPFAILNMFACLALFSSTAIAADPPKAAPRAALVTVDEAITKDVPVKLRAVGTVEPSSSVMLKARTSGELKEIMFTEGQDVQAGQLLFVLDKLPNELAVQEVNAQLESSKANLAKAESDLGRSQTLAKGGFTSAESNQQALTTVAMQRAQIKGNEAALERALLNLSYCEIEAPIAGRVGAVLVDKGNLVQAMGEALVRIDTIEPVVVNFSVPERYLDDIRKLSAQNQLSVFAQAPNGDPVEGVLTFIGNADSRTGTVPLKASFINKNRVLWPGVYVEVQLQLSVLANAVVVPSRAVIIGPQGDFVYVVGEDMKAEYRLVTTSVEAEGVTVIVSGVKPGEKIVREGHVRLAPNIEVRLAEEGSNS